MSTSYERLSVRAAHIAWLAIFIATIALALVLAYWVGALGNRVILQYVVSTVTGSPPPVP